MSETQKFHRRENALMNERIEAARMEKEKIYSGVVPQPKQNTPTREQAIDLQLGVLEERVDRLEAANTLAPDGMFWMKNQAVPLGAPGSDLMSQAVGRLMDSNERVRRRRIEVRKSALSKLTDEEREELGV